jgi:uncharacterized protein with ParB-like and HNH nuclease domain
MGPDKGRNLKQAILSRNNKNWHSFEEIEGIDDDWDDIADNSPETHRRQNSLERNNSFFPWSTPKHNMNESTSNARGTNRRRRMSSLANAARIDVLQLQERQNDDDSTSSIND